MQSRATEANPTRSSLKELDALPPPMHEFSVRDLLLFQSQGVATGLDAPVDLGSLDIFFVSKSFQTIWLKQE